MYCELHITKKTTNIEGVVEFKCVRCGKRVSFDRLFFYNRCNDDIKEAAKYAGSCEIEEDVSAQPPILEPINNYLVSVKRWAEAGNPARSDEEVERIFTEHCNLCVVYDAKYQRCADCNCKLNREEAGLLLKLQSEGIHVMKNKIRMKTEFCPRGFWGDDPLKKQN